MDFEEAHAAFLERHLSLRSGERKARLIRGHNTLEKLMMKNLWWPLVGNFDHLHPEYEVYDWNRKSVFLDLAYIPAPYVLIGMEGDGFQTHVKEMDRDQHSYSLNRDSFLLGLGWKMMHFSRDDIVKRPELCRMLMQHVIGPHLVKRSSERLLTSEERDLLHLAWKLARPIRPKDVVDYFGINFRTARNMLRSLVDKGVLKPIEKGGDVRYYEIVEGSFKHLL